MEVNNIFQVCECYIKFISFDDSNILAQYKHIQKAIQRLRKDKDQHVCDGINLISEIRHLISNFKMNIFVSNDAHINYPEQ